MDKLVKTLGIDRLSKSQVSRMATDLDEHVTSSATAPWTRPARSPSADALTMKVREGGRVINAVGVMPGSVTSPIRAISCVPGGWSMVWRSSCGPLRTTRSSTEPTVLDLLLPM